MFNIHVRPLLRSSVIGLFALFLLNAVFESSADARVGGGRSSGRSSSFGSRRYSPPPSRNPGYPAQPANPGGGFMRGLAGGIAGGFLGSMLFGTLGHAGGFGGGGGVGILEILLIAGLAFFGFRWWKNRNQTTPFNRNTSSYSAPTMEEPIMNQPNFSSLDTEEASDMFFKIQGAWTRRDLSSVRDLLGGEMPSVLNRDLEDLKRNQQINRLENISVRRTDVTDSWNENGVDYSTVRFTANLLDYVVDEKTSQVVQGSDSSPVKFEEDWTFAKNPGTPNWQLVAIQQV